MQFSINIEQKEFALNTAIAFNEADLYQSLIMAGYDPEQFDESSYVVPEEAYPMSIYHKIETLLEKIATLKVMLANLQA